MSRRMVALLYCLGSLVIANFFIGERPSLAGSSLQVVSTAQSTPSLEPLRRRCTTTLPPDQGVVCCLFGYIIVDGQVVQGAHVTAHTLAHSISTTSSADAEQEQPIYSLELNPALGIHPGENLALSVEYAGHTHSVSYTVQADGQQVDIVIPMTGQHDHIFERAIPVQPETVVGNLLGVAVDSSGTAYILDSGDDSISIFDDKGQLIHTIDLVDRVASQLNASSIAVDTAGLIYVTDTIGQRVLIFDSQGTFLSQLTSADSSVGPLNTPKGIAVDAQKNVYVADTSNNRIVIFTPDQQIVAWGSAGSEPGQFQAPTTIAIAPDDTLAISDRENNRIQFFSNDGSFVGAIGGPGSGPAQFDGPYGVAVDSAGKIYVADTGNNRVQLLTSSGTLLATWGVTGSDIGEFNSLYGIAVDHNGRVYLADAGNHRVQVFRPMSQHRPFATITHQAHSEISVAEPFTAFGLGQVSDSTSTIQTYRWALDQQIMPGSDATLTIAAGRLALGDHALRLDVQDSQGRWSEPVSTTIRINGHLTFIPIAFLER